MTTTHADHADHRPDGRHPGRVAAAAGAGPGSDAGADPGAQTAAGPGAGSAAEPAADPAHAVKKDRRRRPGRPRSEAAERAILDAVLELLGQGVSYPALSMEQVAARAGVGKATVYRRWQNKEQLVVDAVTSLWIDCPTPDLTDGGTTRDRLVQYLVTMADAMHSDRAGLVFASVMATAMTNPELVRRYQQVAIEPRRDQIRVILRHGMAAGELRPDLDVELTVRMLAGPIVLTMKTECLDAPLPDGFAAALVDNLMLGVAAR